ncbi:HK97 gp10 family phage protein [Vagococcus sp. BWB3-3]|uniref:HK97 gp10 family phage protein n=1 Tax=Vagococcus allomyrinae TaxID=2794353 RepID=A0A940PAB9_9ENTE|nr:HK97-gp10 family putative phage morphogenesis protein [Vagococcus allomyrinae]MBP1040368.1 HK97 gp10 family phage protein [Vagococcus allomyrinae]
MADGIEFNIDELMKNLDLTEQKMNRGVNKVLKESAKPLKQEIESRTNRSDAVHKFNDGHAADDVVITNVKGGMSDEKHLQVGYQKTAWRMFFVEFGTFSMGNSKGIAPQHIVQRSIVVKKADVRRIQVEGLRRVLGT